MCKISKTVIGLLCIALLEMMGLSPVNAQSSSFNNPANVEPPPKSAAETSTPQPAPLIPFARQEQALKNSERWKTMTEEERQEALGKILHYRELFNKQQAELWKQYKPLLEQKPKKEGRLSNRRRSIANQQFEDVWLKWQALSLDRQKRLTKKWKMQESLPSQRRKNLQQFWNNLLPGRKQRFMYDLR